MQAPMKKAPTKFVSALFLCLYIIYLRNDLQPIQPPPLQFLHVWNRLFGDSYDEYERPSLKWILSEMVGESVMKDERLSSINPYFPRENGGCIYPYFFDMMVDGKLVLDTLDAMYKSQSIEDFMRNSYAYCKEHEAAIRHHIQRSEG